MASPIISSHKAGAEIFCGDAECKEKIYELLVELYMPKGLFPLEDIEEFGYNRASGFIWMVQKKKKNHTFKKINRQVSYATEVTAFIEPHKMKKITGVKTKELMLWLSVVEMYFEKPTSKDSPLRLELDSLIASRHQHSSLISKEEINHITIA